MRSEPGSRSLPQVRRFAHNRRGIAAVEFAFILPFMLALFVGITEVGEAISISRKVTITTRIVTDLVTQYTSVSSSDLTTILGASAQVIAPYASSNLVVTVSEISTDKNGNATVTWSQSLNGTALKCGNSFTLPTSLVQPNISLIYGQVTYNFTPLLGYNIIGPIALADSIYMSPRLVNQISGPSC